MEARSALPCTPEVTMGSHRTGQCDFSGIGMALSRRWGPGRGTGGPAPQAPAPRPPALPLSI